MHETGGPEVFQIEDVPVPRPGPTEVLIKVAACGLCGHDQADRSGLTPVKLPVILGHEISGTVAEVGDKVSAIHPGDRVAAKQFTTCGWCDRCRSGREMECSSRHFNYGGFAEYVVLDVQAVLRLPDGIDLTGASIIACAAGSCLRALRVIAEVLPGEHVAVTGAGGGLGLHGLQIAKALGAHTIAITSSPHKVADLKAHGADEVVLAEGSDYWRAILEHTGGHGVDVVLDNVGHPALFGPCFRALARQGRYVFTGQLYRQKVDLYPAFVFGKEATITGSASTRMAEFIETIDLVTGGAVVPVVQTFPLDQIGEAWRQVDDRRIFGRAVVVP
jgi:D-arabinose 1-dehydrogenase-like Zn-dependent alcohol dehydrogenase